ncbi:MAG TPA: hypothetical protein VH062_37770 [Polyangiaceae bacterium]|jgi:(2S)-methylsuccinyl-CoA dehydrogenase|nr:hypothetical protein [Polyangiaceae bacterium]
MTISDACREVVDAAARLSGAAVARATAITEKGARIDDHQVLSSRVAYAATEARAAQELCALTAGFGSRSTPYFEKLAEVASALLAASVRDRLTPVLEDLGLGDADVDAIYTERVRGHLRKLGHESAVREIGRQVAADKGHTPVPLDETLEQVRRSVRQFVEVEVAPQAEHIHRHDELRRPVEIIDPDMEIS